MPSEQMNDIMRREFGLPSLGAAGASGVAPPTLQLDLSQGYKFQYTLTGACFVGEPINPTGAGEMITLSLIQGGSGSYAVTWASCFRDTPNWSSGGAVGTRATAVFVYDGVSYQYVGGSSAFAVANMTLSVGTGSLALVAGVPLSVPNPQPTAGAVTFAGVASTLTANTIVVRGPTVGAVTLAGVAPVLTISGLQPPTAQISIAGVAPVRTP